MKIDVLTIFPEFFEQVFDFGIIRRAKLAGIVEINVHDIREFTVDKHRMVDDRPFGGGDGMVLKPEPIFAAVEQLLAGFAAGSALCAGLVDWLTWGRPFASLASFVRIMWLEMPGIRLAIETSEGIESVIHMKTLHLGPEELLVAAKIGVRAASSAQDVAAVIDAAERAVRAAEATAQVIYLEPDIYRPDHVPDERPAPPAPAGH